MSTLPSKMPGLDGWRAMAFLAVFFHHAGLLDGGYLGVQAFFVLSGFLLTPILVELRHSQPSIRSYLITFYGRRFLRIFPLFYVFLAGCLVIFGALAVAGVSPHLAAEFVRILPYAASYTLNIRMALTGENPMCFGHLWSLAVEEQFYLAWPFVMLLLRGRHVPVVLLSILVMAPVLRAALYVIAYTGHMGAAIVPDLLIYMFPVSHLDAFACGGLAALLRPRWLQRLAPLLLGAPFLLGLLVDQWLNGAAAWSALGFPPYMHGGWRCVWGWSAVNVGFAAAILAVAQDAFLPRLFRWPPLQYLGRISYGLYVYHWPILWSAGRATFLPQGWVLPLAFVATVVVSAASYHWLEMPLLACKDLWFPNRPKGDHRDHA